MLPPQPKGPTPGTDEDRDLFPKFVSPPSVLDKKHKVWTVGNFTFRADFDSANLENVQERALPNEFDLYTTRDNQGRPFQTSHCSWFYFSITGAKKGDFLVFSVRDLPKSSKLYAQDYRPKFLAYPSMTEFDHLKNRVTYDKEGDGYRLRFHHKFDNEDETFFCYCYPWSYTENQRLLDHIGDCFAMNQTLTPGALDSQIYYRRQLLAYTPDGRDVECITITDVSGGSLNKVEPMIDGAFPECASEGPVHEFVGKKLFFVSARVHPGETPAAHIFNGILAFLLRTSDARAAALRRKYVFKLVPMVNPDGVYRGHYRMDSLGNNLNRHYVDPNRSDHPSVYAIKQLLMHYAKQEKLDFYIDLHAHANKKGVFNFGNALEGEAFVQTLLYSKLCALANPYFEFGQCNFTEKNMSLRDKNGDTKDGAGRVALFRETGLTHLYTVEANYNVSRAMGPIAQPPSGRDGAMSPQNNARQPVKYTVDSFQSMGRGLLIGALDLINANPWSRLPGTKYGDVDGVRNWVISTIKSMPDKKDPNLPSVSSTSVVSARDIPHKRLLSHRTSASSIRARMAARRDSRNEFAANVEPENCSPKPRPSRPPLGGTAGAGRRRASQLHTLSMRDRERGATGADCGEEGRPLHKAFSMNDAQLKTRGENSPPSGQLSRLHLGRQRTNSRKLAPVRNVEIRIIGGTPPCPSRHSLPPLMQHANSYVRREHSS